MADPRHLIKFTAANGFTVVLEYGTVEEMEPIEKKIQDAGLKTERLETYHFNFSEADLFMDMRSYECTEQFDLDDWL
jgi:hypothetical protein